jgi:hypothetical protein
MLSISKPPFYDYKGLVLLIKNVDKIGKRVNISLYEEDLSCINSLFTLINEYINVPKGESLFQKEIDITPFRIYKIELIYEDNRTSLVLTPNKGQLIVGVPYSSYSYLEI